MSIMFTPLHVNLVEGHSSAARMAGNGMHTACIALPLLLAMGMYEKPSNVVRYIWCVGFIFVWFNDKLPKCLSVCDTVCEHALPFAIKYPPADPPSHQLATKV